MNIIKVVQVVGVGFSLAGTLLASWVQDKKMNEAIKAQVEKTFGNK